MYFRITSISVAIEDISIDDTIWGSKYGGKRSEPKNTRSTNIEGMSKSVGILRGVEHGRVRKVKV